jgi:hypothetical protein
MDLTNLKSGTYTVKHPDRLTLFMLSVIRDKFDCIWGVAAYEIGERAPRCGKHMMLNESVKKWLGELEIVLTF